MQNSQRLTLKIKTSRLKKFFRIFPVIALVLLILNPVVVSAQTRQQLESQSNSLQQQITESEARLKQLAGRKNTLANRLEVIRAENAKIQSEIKLTKARIAETGLQIEQAEMELVRNQDLVRQNARTVYKNGDPSIVEILFSSHSFADFISRHEYLSSARQNLNEAKERINTLKQELEEKQERQEQLQSRLSAQQVTLAAQEAEQRQLLEQTRGEERRYQQQVARDRAEYKTTESLLNQITECLGSGGSWADNGCVRQTASNATGAGGSGGSNAARGLAQVSRGQTIGQVGSTGLSTGPHLHFEIRRGTDRINPGTRGALANDYSWPVGNGGGYVSQGFGCTSLPFYSINPGCPSNAPYWHSGIDIAAPSGTPILASAHGTITFRGWLGAYGNTVIIDHGNGYNTLYAHMLQ